MSQKKVDAYKENKANRSKMIKKEKRMILLEKTIGVLVLAACVCWIGYSAYRKAQPAPVEEPTASVSTELNTSALDDYMSSLDAEVETEDTAE